MRTHVLLKHTWTINKKSLCREQKKSQQIPNN